MQENTHVCVSVCVCVCQQPFSSPLNADCPSGSYMSCLPQPLEDHGGTTDYAKDFLQTRGS